MASQLRDEVSVTSGYLCWRASWNKRDMWTMYLRRATSADASWAGRTIWNSLCSVDMRAVLRPCGHACGTKSRDWSWTLSRSGSRCTVLSCCARKSCAAPGRTHSSNFSRTAHTCMVCLRCGLCPWCGLSRAWSDLRAEWTPCCSRDIWMASLHYGFWRDRWDSSIAQSAFRKCRIRMVFRWNGFACEAPTPAFLCSIFRIPDTGSYFGGRSCACSNCTESRSSSHTEDMETTLLFLSVSVCGHTNALALWTVYHTMYTEMVLVCHHVDAHYYHYYRLQSSPQMNLHLHNVYTLHKFLQQTSCGKTNIGLQCNGSNQILSVTVKYSVLKGNIAQKRQKCTICKREIIYVSATVNKTWLQ